MAIVLSVISKILLYVFLIVTAGNFGKDVTGYLERTETVTLLSQPSVSLDHPHLMTILGLMGLIFKERISGGE